MYVAYAPYLPPAPSAGVEVKKVNVFPQQKPRTWQSGTNSLQKGYF